MDNNNFYWKKVIGGKRPVAKKDFTFFCGCIPIDIKKRTVGAFFDETSIMDENAWAEKGVVVSSNTHIKSGTYVSGKKLILKEVSLSDGVFLETSGRIEDTKISSRIRIAANIVNITKSVISNETTISSLENDSEGGVKIENSVLSECFIRGNATIVDSAIDGDIYIDENAGVAPQIKRANIKGDCSICGNARISGELFVSESSLSDNIVLEEALSARIVRSEINANAILTGSKVVIFDSCISNNAKIGGNVIITKSRIRAQEELDYISVSPIHFPLQIDSADITCNADVVTFYMGDNKNIAVYRGITGKATIASKELSTTTANDDSAPAHIINQNCVEYVFRSAMKENTGFAEWAKWIQKESNPEEINEYMSEKYLRFRDEIRLPEEDDNFTLSLITWGELSLAAAVLSERKLGFGFLTRREILNIAERMSSNVIMDLFSKKVSIKNTPVVLTFSAIDAIAKKHKIPKEKFIQTLMKCKSCIFADFKIK